jgi:hypothetical protein
LHGIISRHAFRAGKSLVAIELSKLIDGEVINADAMQMYEGLDVATAKVTSLIYGGICADIRYRSLRKSSRVCDIICLVCFLQIHTRMCVCFEI